MGSTYVYFLICNLAAGYDNGTGEWDEYPPYMNAEGLEIGSPVSKIYCSIIFVYLYIRYSLLYFSLIFDSV